MPTLIENKKNLKSKFNFKNIERDNLDEKLKNDSSDNDNLNLEKDSDDEIKDQFKTKHYDGFQVKFLPNKDRLFITKNYLYIDPQTFSIVWLNIGLFIFLHSFAFYGFYLLFTQLKFNSFLTSYFYGIWGGLGITAGGHRLWSHRSYSARLPLRIFLMIGHTIAGQNNLLVWCRDHRVHHKYSETDADPHNSLRGFFFAHMGWLLRKKHPEVITKGVNVPLNDISEDPVVRFQVKYYYFLYIIFAVFLPTWMGAYFFDEGWLYSFSVCTALRYVTSLHCTWFVNSAAHMFGDKPYNIDIGASENIFVSLMALGEGFHNYHHSFPWDYSTSEFNSFFNPTKYFIDFMSYFGLAFNLKRCSKNIIKSTISRNILNKERQKLGYF